MNHYKLNHFEGHIQQSMGNQEAFETITKLPSTKDMQKIKQKIADLFSHYFLQNGIDRKGNEISDNILGDSMSEIALCIMQKDFVRAQLLWDIITSLYTTLQKSSNIGPIAEQFESLKHRKLGTNGVDRYILKDGENRLLMLKSAIDGLE